MKSLDTLPQRSGFEYVSFTRTPPRGEPVLSALSPDKESLFEFRENMFSSIQEAYDFAVENYIKPTTEDPKEELKESIMELIIVQRMEVDPFFCRVLSILSGNGVFFYFCDTDHYWGCTIPRGLPVEERPLHAKGANRLGELYHKIGKQFYEAKGRLSSAIAE